MTRATSILTRAPLRISFGGGGTDLPAYAERYGGFVVSAAIDRYATVSAAAVSGGAIRLVSHDYGLTTTMRPDGSERVREPLPLAKAVVNRFVREGWLRAGEGLELTLRSDAVPGTGLGSSSAMIVALAAALSSWAGLAWGPGELAETACRIELGDLKAPIGRQDQYASAFGGLNAISFLRDVRVQQLELSDLVKKRLEKRLLLFATGKTRAAASVLAQQSRDITAKPKVTDGMHRMKELAEEMCAALKAGELDRFGGLLDEAWRHKRSLSKKISSREIDSWYEAARRSGALGGKITGAGGGGHLLLFAADGRTAEVRSAMLARGLVEVPVRFCGRGAHATEMAVDEKLTASRPVEVPGAGPVRPNVPRARRAAGAVS